MLQLRLVRGDSNHSGLSEMVDSIDCMMIAHYLMTVEYKPYPSSFYHAEKLKSLTRFRDSLIRLRSRQLVELTNILDKVFPEFKPFFGGKFSVTALYILSNYSSPEKISNMFYAKKRAEGKPHRVALSHVVKKLLRVIYTLQTKKLAYDADFVR